MLPDHCDTAETGQALSRAMASAAAVDAEQNLHRSRVGQLTGMLDDARSTASAAERQRTAAAQQVGSFAA